jgi:replication factor C subunit 1
VYVRVRVRVPPLSQECEALIVKYGGRVVGSISGKTHYLVRGTDDKGTPMESSKVTKARSMPNCKIVDEDGLLELIRKTASQPEPPPAAEPAAALQPPAARAAVGGSSANAATVKMDVSESLPALPKPDGAEALWAEKYRPHEVRDLMGNADHVRKLLTWLQTWEKEAAALAAREGEKAPKGDKGPTFCKAALLSGPPGVGKTSTAKVVLRQAGYDVVELNASDARSEKAIKAMASDMVGNTSIADFATSAGVGGGHKRPTNGRMAVIMDEVDGMSSGDRGGMSQLIKTIAASRMPIICICNDRQAQKVKSLANHCLDCRFRRPTPLEVKTALRRVLTSEGCRTPRARTRPHDHVRCDARAGRATPHAPRPSIRVTGRDSSLIGAVEGFREPWS